MDRLPSTRYFHSGDLAACAALMKRKPPAQHHCVCQSNNVSVRQRNLVFHSQYLHTAGSGLSSLMYSTGWPRAVSSPPPHS
eukprot:COSAG01_NODE_23953_length_795_cov_8.616379_1_plen_80_part_10